MVIGHGVTIASDVDADSRVVIEEAAFIGAHSSIAAGPGGP